MWTICSLHGRGKNKMIMFTSETKLNTNDFKSLTLFFVRRNRCHLDLLTLIRYNYGLTKYLRRSFADSTIAFMYETQLKI
jgi:hypothetical protein